jgi:hypothetical protein
MRSTAIALAALVLACCGVGYGASRATDQVIQACASKSDGSLRIAPQNGCDPAGYDAVTWNSQGPQGPPGAAGVSASPTQVVAFPNPKLFTLKFAISTPIDDPGTYAVHGLVEGQIPDTSSWIRSHAMRCRLWRDSSVISGQTQLFPRNQPAAKVPVDLYEIVKIDPPATGVDNAQLPKPVTMIFDCNFVKAFKKGKEAIPKWFDPKITVEKVPAIAVAPAPVTKLPKIPPAGP